VDVEMGGTAAERPARYRGVALWLRVAALGVAGLSGAFWLVFAVGEVAGGDWSGISHAAPVAAMALLVLFAFRRPAPGAVALLTLGVAWSLYLRGWVAAAVMGGPFVVVGLLLGSAWLLHARKREPENGAQP
jgi:hypothetical protein